MQPDSKQLLAARSSHVDEMVRALSAEYLEQSFPVPFSLLAVGGYGREELFPQSDVDLILLVDREPDPASIKEPLSIFLRELWDCGVRASHSVRTTAECTRLQEQNTELHISLLDARLLCGNLPAEQLLRRALPYFYRKHEARITRDLAEMARRRHAKFNDTVYHLEPNIKEAPGGMRDIHFLHWLTLLAKERGAVRETLEQMRDSKNFLYSVRCFLHQRSNRDYNLLSFELQDRVAESWAETPMDPAEWMRLYYRHARLVFHSALKALEFAELRTTPLAHQFREWRGRLSNSDFTVSHERVLLRNPALTMNSATSVLELFTFLARHGLHLSWDANRRLLAHHDELIELLGRERISWTAWREFFAQPYVALALREMQGSGLLTAAIPGWTAVECLVVRDFYHRYTVDEHSIVAVEVIDRLAEKGSALPARMRNLLAEDDQAAVLRLALLLHDVGKGVIPGDHVKGSLQASETVFERLSVPESNRTIIRFLIEHHLDLSTVMNGRDLDDPATARFLTSRIGTEENLRRLTLLTFADISAVNPTAMTPWRLEQLWRVYLAGQEQLTRELMADRIGQEVSQVLASAEPGLLEFLKGFPRRYLRTHSEKQLRHHMELDQRRKGSGTAVEITPEAGVYLLTVAADDKPGHFASVCGALASFGMNILKAEAAANHSGCFLDLIRFADPLRTLELNPGEVGALERTVRSAVEGTSKISDLLKRRRVPFRPAGVVLAPSFRFNNEASDFCTLIDFVGDDRPGLLYDLTSAISAAGCNIELVLVDTEARKAMDVFYVTDNAGKLSGECQTKLAGALARAAAVN